MSIITAMCTSYKKELFEARHNHLLAGGNTFNLALYTSSANLGAGTTAYNAAGEVPDGGTYLAKGKALTNIDPQSSGTTAFTQFQDLVWSASTITARGCLIFNDTDAGDASVSVHDFGEDKISVDGNFEITMPVNDELTALLRLV